MQFLLYLGFLQKIRKIIYILLMYYVLMKKSENIQYESKKLIDAFSYFIIRFHNRCPVNCFKKLFRVCTQYMYFWIVFQKQLKTNISIVVVAVNSFGFQNFSINNLQKANFIKNNNWYFCNNKRNVYIYHADLSDSSFYCHGKFIPSTNLYFSAFTIIYNELSVLFGFWGKIIVV